MSLGEQCPGCKKPLSGRECQSCGTNPSEEDIVTCKHCGDYVVERKTESYKNNKPSRTGYIYVCWECQ